MKTSFILATAAFAGFSVAQFQELPRCAQECATDILTGGVGDCDTSNIACVCSNEDFLNTVACCLAGVCNEEDQSSAVVVASQLCAANDVSVPSAVVCSTTASGSGSGASSEPTPTDDSTAASDSDDAAWRPRETGLAGAVMGGLAVAAVLL